jgi:hypothetical protein
MSASRCQFPENSILFRHECTNACSRDGPLDALPQTAYHLFEKSWHLQHVRVCGHPARGPRQAFRGPPTGAVFACWGRSPFLACWGDVTGGAVTRPVMRSQFRSSLSSAGPPLFNRQGATLNLVCRSCACGRNKNSSFLSSRSGASGCS